MLLRQPAQNHPNRRLKAPKEKNWSDNFEICSDNIFQQQVKVNLTSSCRSHTIFQKVTPCFLRPCKHAQARNPSHKWGAGRTVLGQGAAARRMRPLDRGTAERGISRSELEQRKLLGRVPEHHHCHQQWHAVPPLGCWLAVDAWLRIFKKGTIE